MDFFGGLWGDTGVEIITESEEVQPVVSFDQVTPEEERMWKIPDPSPSCARCRGGMVACLSHGFLGGGGFGQVFVGQAIDADLDKRLGKVALKRCYIHKEDDKSNIQREIEVMLRVNKIASDHLIRLIDVYYDPGAAILVVPKLGPEVFSKLLEEKAMSEKDAFDIIFQLTSALDALHQNGICHFDVKLENIAYRYDDPTCTTVCLIDLGLANQSLEWPLSLRNVKGTPLFLPPESLRRPHLYGPATDVFGMGAALYTMLAGKYPYTSERPERGDVRMLPLSPFLCVSDACRDIVSRMLDPNPATRITIADMKLHAWFTQTPSHLQSNIMTVMHRSTPYQYYI